MIAATEGWVRLLVRRPHAYWFLEEHTDVWEVMIRPDPTPDAPAGAIVLDGSRAPIPGFVLLDADGATLGTLPLRDATEADVLDALRDLRP